MLHFELLKQIELTPKTLQAVKKLLNFIQIFGT